MRQLLFVLLVFLCSCYTIHSKKYFHDKYLLYVTKSQSADTAFWGHYFVAYINDTIVEVPNYSGYRRRVRDSSMFGDTNWTVPAWASNPYFAERIGDGIYFKYIYYNRIYLRQAYSLNKRDTLNFSNYVSYRSPLAEVIYTTYTGIDTIVRINNIKFKCYKMIELVSMANGGRTFHEKYIERNTCLPLMYRTVFYPFTYNKKVFSSSSITYARLRISKSEITSREFQYPPYVFPEDTFDYRCPPPTQPVQFDSIQLDDGSWGIFKRSDTVGLYLMNK